MSIRSAIGETRPGVAPCEFCNFLQEIMTMERLDPLDECRYLVHLSRTHGLEK